eukprot:6135649-Prymnesium_polylepis.1
MEEADVEPRANSMTAVIAAGSSRAPGGGRRRCGGATGEKQRQKDACCARNQGIRQSAIKQSGNQAIRQSEGYVLRARAGGGGSVGHH